jgi:ketosteroid isomerase-like protein
MIDIEAEKNEIDRLMQAWVKADNDKDLDRLMSFFDSDVIGHMPFTAEVRGIKANRKQWAEEMTETGFWTFETKKFDVSSDAELAYLTGFYHFTVKDWKADFYYPESKKGEIVDDGKMLVVWKNTDDGWKIVAFSSSSDLPSK